MELRFFLLADEIKLSLVVRCQAELGPHSIDSGEGFFYRDNQHKAKGRLNMGGPGCLVRSSKLRTNQPPCPLFAFNR